MLQYFTNICPPAPAIIKTLASIKGTIEQNTSKTIRSTHLHTGSKQVQYVAWFESIPNIVLFAQLQIAVVLVIWIF
jgi:hypothetical protein